MYNPFQFIIIKCAGLLGYVSDLPSLHYIIPCFIFLVQPDSLYFYRVMSNRAAPFELIGKVIQMFFYLTVLYRFVSFLGMQEHVESINYIEQQDLVPDIVKCLIRFVKIVPKWLEIIFNSLNTICGKAQIEDDEFFSSSIFLCSSSSASLSSSSMREAVKETCQLWNDIAIWFC